MAIVSGIFQTIEPDSECYCPDVLSPEYSSAAKFPAGKFLACLSAWLLACLLLTWLCLLSLTLATKNVTDLEYIQPGQYKVFIKVAKTQT